MKKVMSSDELNKKYNAILDRMFKINKYVITVQDLLDEIIKLEERVQIGQNAYLSLSNRIDKAIELLEKYGNGTFDEDLLNILQGKDK